jgi:hypothetical protein
MDSIFTTIQQSHLSQRINQTTTDYLCSNYKHFTTPIKSQS